MVESYVKKGSKLYIEGKIQYKEYEKEGQKKYFTSIVGNELKMLDSKATVKEETKETKTDLPF